MLGLEAIRAFAKEQGQGCSTDLSCFQWVKKKRWLGEKVDTNIILANYKIVQGRPNDKEAKIIYAELKTYYNSLNYLSDCMKQ